MIKMLPEKWIDVLKRYEKPSTALEGDDWTLASLEVRDYVDCRYGKGKDGRISLVYSLTHKGKRELKRARFRERAFQKLVRPVGEYFGILDREE